MKKWTVDNIPDQKGRIALVTGANSGLGFEISQTLALKNAEVILACRDEKKAKTAIEHILTKIPKAKLTFVKLDLSDLDSVSECAEEVKKKYKRLDLLINNAGIMVPPFLHTKQGFELQFGTNHLGHFALTGKLLPIMAKIAGARIVSVSSIAASLNYINFNDLNYEQNKYFAWQAYGQSKLANQMCMKELAQKLNKNKFAAISVGAHPGVSTTNLFKNSASIIRKLYPLISHSPNKGAESILRAATDLEAKNGSYWGPSGLFGVKGAPAQAKLQSKTLNPNLTQQLWEISEKQTGVKFPIQF